MIFHDPEDEGGAAVADDLTPAEGVEGGGNPEPPAAPVFDPKEFATTFGKSIADSLRQHAPAAPTAPTAPLSPEEAKRLLNVWEPDDAFVQEFGNLDTQKTAFAKMRDNLIKQADTIAQVRMQHFQAELEKQYAPLRQLVEQHEARERQQRFNTTYSQLADPGLTPLLGSVAQQLQGEGKTFGSEKELFDEIAKRVEAVLKISNPSFKLSAAGRKPGPPTSIPVTTPGGGGGGSSNGDGETMRGVPRAVSLMPKIRT